MRYVKLRIILLLILLFSGAANTPALRIKIAVIAPKRSIWGRKLSAWAREVKQKTAGRVKLKIYYGGVQGDEAKVVRLIKIGRLQGAGFMARGISKICPDSLVFALPMVFHDEEEAIAVQKKMQPYLQQQAAKNGYEILGWTRQGFTYCFSQVKVDSIAALRRAKPWMLEKDAFCESFFRLSHIAAIPAPVGDVLVALQSGMIQTVFAPPIGMLIMQWQSRVKYQLSTGLFYSFGAMVVSKRYWRKLSAADRATVKKLFTKYNNQLNAAINKQNSDALKILQRKLTVVVPKPEARQELYAMTDKVAKDMEGKAFSKRAMQMLRRYLKEYRQQHRKTAKKTAM